MRRRRAFTLVELLVVISIIAMLAMLITPMLSKARDMARQVACKSNLSNLGKVLAGYASVYKSYPNYSPWIWRMEPPMFWESGESFTHELDGWAKIYGLLEYNDFKGTRKTTYGNWYYGGPVNRIWPGALCPAMDAAKILSYANHAGNYGFESNPMYYTWLHPWAVGYQWNPMLRAATTQPPHRHGVRLTHNWVDMWQWIQPWAYLPIGSNPWTAHATSPAELQSPANTAEAWDTFDPEATPNIDWWGQKQSTSQFCPGWHAGMTHVGATAMFNGARHRGPPSMLYGDGAVRSDATRRIDPAADDLPLPRYEGVWAYTWPDWNDTFGTYHHLVPYCEFEGGAQ